MQSKLRQLYCFPNSPEDVCTIHSWCMVMTIWNSVVTFFLLLCFWKVCLNWVLMDRPFCTFEKRVAKIYFSWNWAFYPYIPVVHFPWSFPQTRPSWISFEDVTARFPLVYQCASHINRFSQGWASLSLRPVSFQQRKTLSAVWPSAAADTCCFFPPDSMAG